ncbi:MAG: hypothetical protein FRX49_03388 [Trebouxia sp. A1-2]|nr:MAG: hypothetical protein FRX49_03388 [Trebouxia sp. A1-2]
MQLRPSPPPEPPAALAASQPALIRSSCTHSAMQEEEYLELVGNSTLQQHQRWFAGFPLLLLDQGRYPQHLYVPIQPSDLLLEEL